MSAAPPVAPQQKSNRGLIGGSLLGCGCLLFLLGVGVVAYGFFARAKAEVQRRLSEVTSTTTSTSSETTSTESSSSSTEDTGETKTYTNTKEGRTGNLADSYVDFHFDYPASWTLKPNDPDQVNFVSAERSDNGKTLESFNVGYFQSTGSAEGDAAVYPQLVQQFEQQFSKQFPNLKKLSEGRQQIGAYEAYQALFESEVQGTGGPVKVWIRAAMIPNPKEGERAGVSLLMFGTSLAPELQTADDVGEKGQLPVIVQSFRLGE